MSKRKPKKKRLGKRSGLPATERLAAAIRMHQQGQVEAAAEVYRKILRDLPDQVDALHFLGVAAHQTGDHETALANLDRVLTMAPSHLDARNNRGNVFKKLGRLDEAEADYRRVLEERPKDPNALNNLGTILRTRGRYDEAEAKFREVIALVPKHGPAWQNLGNTLSALERHEEAIEAHRQAVHLTPQSPSTYLHLGSVLAAIGRLSEAREVFELWRDRFPNDPRVQHMLAACSGEATPSRASDDYVRAEFAHFADTFDDKLAQLEYRAPTLIAEELTRVLGAPSPSGAVLDAGCGTGLCGAFLRPRASHLTGVDLSPEMVELARKRNQYDALVVDELTTYLRQQDAAFDLIVSADTLVYFGDVRDVLTAAAQALRPAGVLAFTVERTTANEAPAGFRILPSGRFAHCQGYLAETLARAGLGDLSFQETTLRKEAGRWVEGYLVSARRLPHALS
jgi:predicted TPR repeat methyltransferase